MGSVAHWVSERLRRINQEEFTSTILRKYPSKRLKGYEVHYFSVPLASGLGQSVLIESGEDTGALKTKDLVLMCHGLGHDATDILWPLVEAFVKEGFSVLSFDFDGHGMNHVTHLDFQETSRSLSLILQRLYGSKNGEGIGAVRSGPSCYFFGHGMGASYAMIAAARSDDG